MIDKEFKKNSKLLDEIKEKVIDQYEKRKASRSILEKKWNEFYELYRGIRTKGSYDGRADLDWASAYIAVETLVPRIHSVMFPNTKWFEVSGVEYTDEKQADIISTYLRLKMEKDVKFRLKMISAIRYCAIFGTLIAKTPYKIEKSKVPTRRRKRPSIFNPFGLGTEITDVEIYTKDSIDFDLVDLFDFFPADDTIQDIDDQPFVIHRTKQYLSDMKKDAYDKETGEGIYENLDDIVIDKDKKLSVVKDENSLAKARQGMLGLNQESGNNLDQIEVIEYQGKIQLDNGSKDIDDIIVVIANGDTVVSCEKLNTPDKKKMYVKGVWTDIPGEFYGIGVIERSVRAIYELNDRANQTMDITGQIINPIWINTDADLPEGKLKIFPGRVIRTVTKDGLTPLRPPTEVLSPAYNSIELLTSLIQDTTGATRFLGGSAQLPELQRTATGIVSIIREANARLNLVIQGLEETITKPFLRKAYKYSQFYGTRSEIIRITGKQGLEVHEFNPADILGDYDFRPLGSQSIGSEEVMTQQMLNYLNIIAQIPQVANNFDIMRLVTRIGEKMLGLEEADELVLFNNREQEEQEKATSENMAAMAGIPPVVSSTENHRLHMEIHDGFMQDQRAQQFPKALQLLATHIADHEKSSNNQGVHPTYNMGNSGSTGGLPPQSQPSPTTPQDITNQMSQPSQAGMIQG